MEYNKKLVFENGREFLGFGFGADVETVEGIVILLAAADNDDGNL